MFELEAINALLRELKSPSPAGRIRAIAELTRVRAHPFVWNALVKCSLDADASVRRAATEALDGFVAARPALLGEMVAAQAEEGPTPRWALEKYLARVGTLEAVQGLFDMPIAGGADETAVLDTLAGAPALRSEDLLARLGGADSRTAHWLGTVLARRGVNEGCYTAQRALEAGVRSTSCRSTSFRCCSAAASGGSTSCPRSSSSRSSG